MASHLRATCRQLCRQQHRRCNPSPAAHTHPARRHGTRSLTKCPSTSTSSPGTLQRRPQCDQGAVALRLYSSSAALPPPTATSKAGGLGRARVPASVPSLGEFLQVTGSADTASEVYAPTSVPYLRDVAASELPPRQKQVYIETYGCQMSFADSEVCLSILQNAGFERTHDIDKSNIILAMTCSIRDNAEQKIWQRLNLFKKMKLSRPRDNSLQIGVLGCMAERLKHKLLEADKLVDVVAGPDSYRDLPRLLDESYEGQAQVNVLLSMDETYADVAPVRLNSGSKTAFVSIQRGCDNMCSYCIVPFTRGRERSRPVHSIVDEVRALSEQGVREVTLLGQNVNSYRDVSSGETTAATHNSRGFKTIYKPKRGGQRFAELLAEVAEVDPNMRVRFTSPHPKDFPDELLEVIRDYPNVCKHLHLPAQSGSSAVLDRMRRGYTRESYMELVDHVRATLPDVSLTSDFISGFCGETEEDHNQTLSLMRETRYNMAYMFMYSLREKTNAHRRFEDDVPLEVKNRRHREVAELLYSGAAKANLERVGTQELVLVERRSKRSDQDWMGRTDGNTAVVFPDVELPCAVTGAVRKAEPGDYVTVDVEQTSAITLRGTARHLTRLAPLDQQHQQRRLASASL